ERDADEPRRDGSRAPRDSVIRPRHLRTTSLTARTLASRGRRKYTPPGQRAVSLAAISAAPPGIVGPTRSVATRRPPASNTSSGAAVDIAPPRTSSRSPARTGFGPTRSAGLG